MSNAADWIAACVACCFQSVRMGARLLIYVNCKAISIFCQLSRRTCHRRWYWHLSVFVCFVESCINLRGKEVVMWPGWGGGVLLILVVISCGCRLSANDCLVGWG